MKRKDYLTILSEFKPLTRDEELRYAQLESMVNIDKKLALLLKHHEQVIEPEMPTELAEKPKAQRKRGVKNEGKKD
jgi:5-bromo-4-chloroindolyl phosphate hydrolysis protein